MLVPKKRRDASFYPVNTLLYRLVRHRMYPKRAMIAINASNSPNPGIPGILDFLEMDTVLEGLEDLTRSEVVLVSDILDGRVVVIDLEGITSD